MKRSGQGSALSRSVSAFAHMLSAMGVFILIPLIEQHVRPEFFAYFNQTFSYSVSIWASWGFVGIVIACLFFGISTLFQVLVQLILRRSANKSVF